MKYEIKIKNKKGKFVSVYLVNDKKLQYCLRKQVLRSEKVKEGEDYFTLSRSFRLWAKNADKIKNKSVDNVPQA